MSIPTSPNRTSITNSFSSVHHSSADLESPETSDLARRCQTLTRELKVHAEQLEEKEEKIRQLNNQISGLNAAVDLQRDISTIDSTEESAMGCFTIFTYVVVWAFGAVSYHLAIEKKC